MSQRIYNWPRYWYLRDGSLPWTENGLLSSFSSWSNNINQQKSIFTLTELQEIPCLILLGEAGMGKSQSLKEAYDAAQNTTNDKFCYFDLAEYTSTLQMEQEIFTYNSDFNTWKTEDCNLYLYLDSLDEAFIKISRITERLVRFLKNLNSELNQKSQVELSTIEEKDSSDEVSLESNELKPILRPKEELSITEDDVLDKVRLKLNTLHIRIACRTADWSQIFEEELIGIWGEDFVRVFVLASLRREDISEAAQKNNLNFDSFWEEVRNKNAEAFASSPVMLNFLLGEFRRTGSLPQTKRELYRLGCLAACRDENLAHENHFESEPEQRFIIASKIAALTIFTKQTNILRQQSEHLEEDAILAVRYCAGSKESFDGLDFYLFESFVEETLSTPLFHGGGVRQWSQKTYAEFLAAWYVVHKLTLTQIRSLIFLPDGRIVPQLEETAVWVASFKNEIFDDIVNYDPQILLRSDIATSNTDSKKKLTIALLDQCTANPHLHYDRKYLQGLKHNGLLDILKPILEDKALNETVRECALDIAVSCQEGGLLSLLVKIALDDEESLHLRGSATRGVLEFGNKHHKHQLKPLAFLSLDNRTNGDLKRGGILANWPDNLSAQELFYTLMVPAEKFSLVDHYVVEDWGKLILSELHPSEIPIALQWVTRQGKLMDMDHKFVQFIDEIMLKAWRCLEYPGVVDEFAKTVVALWLEHQDVINRHGFSGVRDENAERLTQEIVSRNNDKRLLATKFLIPIAAKYDRLEFQFRFDLPLLTYSDISWLIAQFNASSKPQEKSLIVNLIQDAINIDQSEQFSYIYEVGMKNPDLWQALGIRLYVELNSDKANQEREIHLRRMENKRQDDEHSERNKRPLVSPSPVERVRQEIMKFEHGNIDAWVNINYFMMFKPNGIYERIHDFDYSFASLPVWAQLEESEQKSIIDSARAFIQKHEPDKSFGNKYRWWEREEWIFWPIVAGCRAFFELFTRDKLDEISLADWHKWAPALTYYYYRPLLFSQEEERRKLYYAFLRHLQSLVPDEFIETTLWAAERENQKEVFFLPSRIKEVLDKRLAQAFISEVQNDKYLIPNSGQLLELIASFDIGLIGILLGKWLAGDSDYDQEAREKAIIAGQLCMRYAADTTWEQIWNLFQKDTDFGDQIIRQIARDERFSNRIASKLTESNLVDLYLWLFSQYPPKDDPPRIGFHEVTIEHEIAGFRDGLLNELVNRGTAQSIQQLKHIQNSVDIDLGYYLNQATIIFRRNIWQPLSPSELNKLIQQKSSRWIQDEKQLLDVIEELLLQLNEELQGKNNSIPAVIDLWNEYPHGKIKDAKRTPKDEERISDYVAMFLKRNLEGKNIFISRETQIRRGNKTDIYIETNQLLTNGTSDFPLTVIIEVKGDWNPELKTALKDQLANQYLAPHGLRHGIYLVGRFFCNAWNKEEDNSRWSKSSRIDDKDLIDLLEGQSDDLELEGFDIRVNILDACLKD